MEREDTKINKKFSDNIEHCTHFINIFGSIGMHYLATLKNRTQFDYLGQKYFVLNYGTQILMFTLADYM